MTESDASSLILIVDDSSENQQALHDVLDAENYCFAYASDGEQALILLQQRPVDLILLDVMMPTMDGYETCRQVRATPELADVPILMVTELDDRASRLTGIKAGADDFASKPLDKDELRARVRSITRLNRYRRLLEQTERLELLEYYDSLTKLANRKRFVEQLDVELQDESPHLAVVTVGIDEFDEVSDTLGHHVGDQILQEIRDRFSELVADGDLLARLAGTTFIVLVKGDDPSAAAQHLGKRLRDAVNQPFMLGKQKIHLTACVGISLAPQDSDKSDVLIANAAAALSQARGEGRNSQQLYTSRMNVAVLRRLTIESRLRTALEQQQLTLRYQPRFDLLSGAASGLEAVVYLRLSGDETPLANVYYEVAEFTGLGEALGDWILQSACAQLAAWADQGLVPPRLVIPVGGTQLLSDNFPARLQALLTQYRVSGSALELAFAEPALKPTRSPADAALVSKLVSLKSLGVRLSIDKFGADTLTLAHLARLPVDSLIIDPGVVHELFESISHGAVTKSTIGLAHNLNLLAVAKGVNTEQQRTFLLSWRCDEGQGDLLGIAQSADELAESWQPQESKLRESN